MYCHHNGQDYSDTKVNEGEYLDKYRYIVLTNPITEKEIPLCNVVYNKDETVIYFDDGRKVFRYDTGNDSCEELLEREPIRKGCSHYVREMVVTSDEKYLYYIVGRTDGEMDELGVLYSCNLETGEITTLTTESDEIENLALTPDEKSIIYFTYSIKKYDLESGKTQVLCARPLSCVDLDFKEFSLSVSPDGRYIIYCQGRKYKTFTSYSIVYAYDTETGKTGAIIKTDLCNIDHVDWAK